MKVTRFSIAGLMGFVLIAGVGFAGLKLANPLWASACFSFMLAALLVSVLNAIQARGKSQAFWVGFASTGWLCLMTFGMFGAETVEAPALIIEAGMDALDALFHPSSASPITSASFVTVVPGPSFTPVAGSPSVVSSTTPTPVPSPIQPAPAVSPTTEDPPTPGVEPAPAAEMAPTPQPPPNVTQTNIVAPIPAPPSLPPITFATPLPYPLVNVTSSGTNLTETSIHFRQVGYSLSILVFSYLGGLYSLMLAARRDRRRSGQVEDVAIAS